MVGPPSIDTPFQELLVEHTRPADLASDARATSGCLAHVWWGLGGCSALLVAALTILRMPHWTLSVRDAVFWAIVASMIAVRALDARRPGATTSSGEAATPRHARSYAWQTIGAALLLWAIVHSIDV